MLKKEWIEKWKNKIILNKNFQYKNGATQKRGINLKSDSYKI
jgi:hypothetical protein